MHYIAQIPCVRAPAFGALFVRYHLYERIFVYRGGVPYHFKPTVKQIVLLIRAAVLFLLLRVLYAVPAFLSDLGYHHNPELEAVLSRVIGKHLFPEP